MSEEKKYFILAYYFFTRIEAPHEEVAKHFAFLEGKDVKARVYISEEGINGQMSASKADALAYMDWLHADPRFSDVKFKIHFYDEHVFPRLTIKVREQLVALDTPCDLAQTGEHVSPERWKQMLEAKDENTLVLDVRNDYEWRIGHFEGAELPPLEQFRDFPKYAKSLSQEKDLSKTKVMMCCTGGIRCELYSALLKQEGFKQVYQLDGGIINYGLTVGDDLWRGKLFVFDDRLAVPIKEGKPAETISTCLYCNKPSDTYYNCANVDCNELFLSCLECAEAQNGCCSMICKEAPRVRAFQKAERPKPFRRLSEVSVKWSSKGSSCSCTLDEVEDTLLGVIQNDS